MINNYIREGKIVPVDVTVGLLKKAMEKNGWEVNNYSFSFDERNSMARRYAGQSFPWCLERNLAESNEFVIVMGQITPLARNINQVGHSNHHSLSKSFSFCKENPRLILYV